MPSSPRLFSGYSSPGQKCYYKAYSKVFGSYSFEDPDRKFSPKPIELGGQREAQTPTWRFGSALAMGDMKLTLRQHVVYSRMQFVWY